MSEVLHEGHEASRIKNKKEEEYSPGFSGEDYDQTDDFNEQESPTESKLGNSIVNAANRVNRLLIAGVELRGDIKQSAETTMIAAKEKVTKFGNSALYASEVVIGYSISGAEAIGSGVNKIKDKAKGAAQDFIGEAKLEYTDFKDTIEFGKKDIKESFNNAKAKVGKKVDGIKSNVSDKVESAQKFAGEKVDSIRNFFKQKKTEALQRKEQRTNNHEQIKLTREQNKVENDQPENEQSDVYTSPEGKAILEATKTPENKKSVLGNTIMSAAERINNALVSGTEKREAMIDTAKEKVKKIGDSALLGADTIGRSIKNTQEKAVGFKDKAGAAMNNAAENIFDRVDKINKFADEKSDQIIKAYIQKQDAAEQRKLSRKSEREQKMADFKVEVKKRMEDAKQRRQERKDAAREKTEAIKETILRNARNIGNSVLSSIDRAQTTGHAAKVAWQTYKPKTSNV